MEKWIMYRHPDTHKSVRLIETEHNTSSIQKQEIELIMGGYKQTDCIVLGDRVSKCKGERISSKKNMKERE